MAILNQKRILNLIPKTSAPVTIHVSQGDVGTEIEFTLVKGDEVFVNPGNVSASVHGVREDGANFGPFTCTLSGNKVTFPLHSEMTAVKGSALAEIVLVDNGGNKVGSANFGILVEQSVFPLGVTYDNDVSVYESILAYVQTIPAQLTNDYTSKINAVKSSLNNEIATRTSEDALINTRIDEIIAPSGEAPSAAEILDARVGVNGTTYDSLGKAIRTQVSDLRKVIDSYPFATEPPSKAKAIVDIRFTSNNTQEFYVSELQRNVGGLYYIAIIDRTNNKLFQVLNTTSYTEPSKDEPQYFSKTVSGITISGYYFIDWSVLSVGETFQSWTTPKFSYLCWRKMAVDKTLTKANVPADAKAVGDAFAGSHNTYPFTSEPDSKARAIVDVHFTDEYNGDYYVERIGRNVNGAYYIILVNKTNNTSHQILNITASTYSEPLPNQPQAFDYSQAGIHGYYYVDWSKIPSGTEYQSWYTPIFSRNCWKKTSENFYVPIRKLIPSKIYSVVGHPISVYYDNVYQLDNIEDYHVQIANGTNLLSRINLGNRFKLLSNSPETYSARFSLRKNDSDNVVSSYRMDCEVLADTPPTIKALFIGDSFIDQGYILAELKRMMGNNLTLYGTVANSGEDSTGVTRSFYDEGHSGWSLKTYNTEASDGQGTVNPFYNSGFDFSYYMTNNPSFSDLTDVFILSGPNDWGAAESPDDYNTYITNIINSIRTYSETIRIHLMNPLTVNCNGYAWGIRNGNGAYSYRYTMFKYGEKLRLKASTVNKIYWIPTHVYFDRFTDFPTTQVAANDRTPTLVDVYNDNVHPNKYGYYCMCDVLYAFIIAHCN